MNVFGRIREHMDWDRKQFAVVIGFILFVVVVVILQMWLNLQFYRSVLGL